MIHAAEFPDAGIGFESVQVGGDEFMQVFAGGFLFAFDDEFDVAWQFAVFIEDGVNGKEPRREMTLVVADAAPVHFPIADFRLEGRRLP